MRTQVGNAKLDKMFAQAHHTSQNFHKPAGTSNVTITNSTTDMFPNVTPEGRSVQILDHTLNAMKANRINQNSGGLEIRESPLGGHDALSPSILSPKLRAHEVNIQNRSIRASKSKLHGKKKLAGNM